MKLDSNCVQLILFFSFYGSKDDLIRKMSEFLRVDEKRAQEFADKFLNFLIPDVSD